MDMQKDFLKYILLLLFAFAYHFSFGLLSFWNKKEHLNFWKFVLFYLIFLLI